MSRILVTGSAAGLGRATAEALLAAGHDVIVHTRTTARREAVRDLVACGAEVVVGDLADLEATHRVADQVENLGRVDVVIHNAGVFTGNTVLPVNVVAPYVLTRRLSEASRHIYLSSGYHRDSRATLAELAGTDWSGAATPYVSAASTYADSKLFVTVLMAAFARLRPNVLSHAVDPGWMPTRMGGPNATGDIRLGHVTQVWLATSNDPEVLQSGQYWHYQRARETHPSVHDEVFQDGLLAALAAYAGC